MKHTPYETKFYPVLASSFQIRKQKFLGGVFTGVVMSEVANYLRRKNIDVLDIYLTLLDAAGLSHSPVFNQNSKAKDRGSWVPFKV